MIQDQIIQIENAQMKKDALVVLEQGNAVLKKLNEEVSIEKWEKVSDDLNDVREQQNEISEFLNTRGIDQQAFDDEINNELADLENNLLKENQNVEAELPSVKSKKDEGENVNVNVNVNKEEEKVAVEN